MKIIRILAKNIRDGIKSVIRNFSLSASSISCIGVTLILLSITMIISYNVENFTKLVKKDFTVVVFINNVATETDIENMKAEINKLSNIDSIKHETKIKIAEDMSETSDVFKSIVNNWKEGENPLQDTLLIKIKKLELINETAESIKKIKNVSAVKYGEGMVDEVLSVFDIVEKVLIGGVILLTIVTFFLIKNTIKITIFSRKDEIDIMRLVGASNFSIKQPFIIEGLFLGFLGALIPIILTIYGYTYLFETFNGQLFSPFVRLVKPEPFIYIVALITLAMGMFVGTWASASTVRKYLKI